MSSVNPSRPSTAELRRRLLTTPTTTTPVVPPTPETDEEPALPPSMARRLAEQAPDTARTQPVGRRTPLPGSNLDLQFVRSKSEAALSPDDDPVALKATNAQLRATLDEVQQILEEAQVHEQAHLERAQKLQEVIVEHEALIHQLEEHVSKLEQDLASRPVLKNANELAEWQDEIERESHRLIQEKKKLDTERRQLQDDEIDLQRQMRDVEVSMARERAMMARQETELKRLSAEIAQILDQSGRGDATLRKQMEQFQRRHQDLLARGAGLSAPGSPAPAPAPVAPPVPPAPIDDEKRDGSLFKRIFGKS
jgi:hypothetical protein